MCWADDPFMSNSFKFVPIFGKQNLSVTRSFLYEESILRKKKMPSPIVNRTIAPLNIRSLIDFIIIYFVFKRLVVSQFYESQVYDEYVIRGNAAVLKCNIPSFVSDHVEVVEWVDTNGGRYSREDNMGIEIWDLRLTSNLTIFVEGLPTFKLM